MGGLELNIIWLRIYFTLFYLTVDTKAIREFPKPGGLVFGWLCFKWCSSTTSPICAECHFKHFQRTLKYFQEQHD